MVLLSYFPPNYSPIKQFKTLSRLKKKKLNIKTPCLGLWNTTPVLNYYGFNIQSDDYVPDPELSI